MTTVSNVVFSSPLSSVHNLLNSTSLSSFLIVVSVLLKSLKNVNFECTCSTPKVASKSDGDPFLTLISVCPTTKMVFDEFCKVDNGGVLFLKNYCSFLLDRRQSPIPNTYASNSTISLTISNVQCSSSSIDSI